MIQVVSYERDRVFGFVNSISKEIDAPWFRWSIVRGLEAWSTQSGLYEPVMSDLTDPIRFLDFFLEQAGEGLYIVEDFHYYTSAPPNPEIIQRLREVASLASSLKKHLLLCQPVKQIPPELLKEMVVLELALPTVKILKVVAETVIEEFDLPRDRYELTEKLIQAALGLTIMEARIIFSKVIVERGRLTEAEIPLIIDEKGQAIKKRGTLEYIHPRDDMSSVGGMDLLKEWLKRRSNAFYKEAEEYGLEKPRGVLLLGVPGCGKSLCAKAVANSWGLPLLRFDLGKVYAGIVGESEMNIRMALDVAKAMAPCVLWIDEIEKGLSGTQSSNVTDAGVSARVFGTFLTWLQEKEEPVFVVATANEVSQIPPELLRKGRFDEIFFVDLPTAAEREEIFRIHLKKKGRDPSRFDVAKLAQAAENFTGAEIEEAVKEGMLIGFDDGREFTTDDVLAAVNGTFPLAQTMKEVIDGLRSWAIFRAKYASSKALEQNKARLTGEPGKVPHLRQEARNPFI